MCQLPIAVVAARYDNAGKCRRQGGADRSIFRLGGIICPWADGEYGQWHNDGLGDEPMKTWLLNVILTEESVIPAANTATEAFAPAMRLKDGSAKSAI